MADFQVVKIDCAQTKGDHLYFGYEPNCTDGKPAGIDMAKSEDGSITLSFDELVKLRDACNEAIAAQE